MNHPCTAFIPVRGGSKSIPLKNIKLFCGQPLVYWNIAALQEVPEVTQIVVATDSDDIFEMVASFNFPKVLLYRRAPENATDTASSESVMLEYLHTANPPPETPFMLVQATSPLTTSAHFEGGLRLFYTKTCDSVLSGVRCKRFFWNDSGESLNYNYMSRPRRQDFSGMILENGAFYINTVANIQANKNRLSGKIAIYEMPEYTATEIDDPDDWIILESLMKRHQITTSQRSFPRIRLVVTDVDGVLTDGGMYYGDTGIELKKFNTHDGMGFQLLREKGLKTAVITSEKTSIVSRRTEKIKADYTVQGVSGYDKLKALQHILTQTGISIAETAYIGDDINCIPILSSVGVAACPSDAQPPIKQISRILTLTKSGGHGVFREFVNLILKNADINNETPE